MNIFQTAHMNEIEWLPYDVIIIFNVKVYIYRRDPNENTKDIIFNLYYFDFNNFQREKIMFFTL